MYATEKEKDFGIKKYLHRNNKDFHCKKQKLVYHIQRSTTDSIQNS